MPCPTASTGRRLPSPHLSRVPRLSAIALASLLAAAASPTWAQAPAPAAAASANENLRAYDLPAAPLSAALNRFAVEAGVLLSIDSRLTDGKTAPALRGRYNTETGLAALLAGSGLRAQRDSRGVYGVSPAPAPAAVPRPAPTRPVAPRAPVEASSVTLPTVEVTAEREQQQRHATSVNSVTREELDRLPPTSVSDIFKGIPGVTAANARNGASFDLNVRGQQGDRVKVLVDGTQSTTNTSKSYGGENNHNYVDPDLVSSIVVEKGPNTGPHGAGTGGGVVNMSTLSADDLLSDGKTWGLRLRGGWANNASSGTGFRNYLGTSPIDVKTPDRNTSGSVAGAWRAPDGKLDLVAVRSERRSGNYYAGSKGHLTASNYGPQGEVRTALSLYKPSQEVFNTSQDTQSTLLKARLQLPADQWLELSHNQLESSFGESRVVAFSYNIEQKPLSEVKKTTSLLRYGWKPAANPFWNLRVNMWGVKLDELHPEITYGVSGSTKTQGMEAWNSSVFDLAGVGLTLAYGGSLQNEKTTGLGITEPRGKRELSSLFVRADAQFNEHLTLDVGLRRESYSTDGTGSFISPIPGQARIPYNVTDGHSRNNPSVGVTFKPVESTAFFLRYSEGWRPPTPKEVGLTYGHNRTVLQPEVTESTEVGVRWNGKNVWASEDVASLGFTMFDNRHTDYLARHLSSGTGSPYYYTNIDGARFKGIELSARYDNGTIFGSYGLNSFEIAQFCGYLGTGCTDTFNANLGTDMAGLVLPPKRTQTLTFGTRLLERRLTLGVRAHFVTGSAGTLVTTAGQTVYTGWSPHEIYDLFGSYRIGRNLDVSFSVDNLRDRYYVEAMTSSAVAIPSPGRTAKVTLTYQF